MAVARVSEITSSSGKSIEDAISSGLDRAARTLRGISGLEVSSIKAKVADGKVAEYRVSMKITFILEE